MIVHIQMFHLKHRSKFQHPDFYRTLETVTQRDGNDVTVNLRG